MKYLLCILLTFSLLYAYEWTPICEEDYSINGFAQNFEGNYPFVLACDEGLLLKNGEEWILESYGGLPVWDVLLIGNGEFLLIQGNGSYSDGVYKFNEFTLEFEVMEWIFEPNFLVYNEDQQEYFIGAYDGLFKSTDGESWEVFNFYVEMNCVDMVFWQNHYVVSVSGDLSGVYYSDDYGITWNASTNSPLITDMSFRNDSTLFGIFPGPSNSSGLWSSTDFGATWQVEFWSDFLSCVEIDMADNIFVGWEADDGVAKWLGNDLIFMNVGLPNLSINKLYVNPALSSIHIMALTNGGAYILTNYTEAEHVLPKPEIKLSNHPNPFNPSTEISFQISDFSNQDLEIQIFNSKGQKLKNLPITQSQNHQISIEWNGTNSIGKPCPSGVYLYKLVSGEKELAANKMLLLK
ncbi:MAG: T9SS type A sorting domain-containing protein [Candidatus Cloacimonadales bacterium]|nr:T9SS type A sorting domain-containing protein [Candidatus Cloacimonadales bacterium]